MIDRRGILIVAAACAGFWGCAPRAVVFLSHDYNRHRVDRVAIMGFQDYPGAPGSGEITASTFEKYLLWAGYSLVERRQVEQVLKEQSLSLTGATDPATIRKIGRILGVDALVFGSLTDFSNIREQTVLVNMPQEQSEPVFGRVVTEQRDKDKTVRSVQPVIAGYAYTRRDRLVPESQTLPAHIGESVRLVDVETGEVLWSATASSDGVDLTAASQQASASIMQAVVKQLKKAAKRALEDW